ncbi:MAG: sigma-70 family RNA polymerase sigma factor [Planctomycetes bacterium]|nr:sigma-70 family RNA polymerase sigma factor [Planctomycetota bacterium]
MNTHTSQGEQPGKQPDDERSFSRLSERELIERWTSRKEQTAATELYRRYVEQLLQRAGHDRASSPYVEDSVFLSAFGSILRQADTTEFYFDHDDWLWRLLATIARRKKLARLRKQRELTGDERFDDIVAIAEGEPSAEEIAEYNEARSRLWAVLGQRERLYLEMRELSYRQKDIARELQIDTRQVRRIAKAVEMKAQRLLGNGTLPDK